MPPDSHGIAAVPKRTGCTTPKQAKCHSGKAKNNGYLSEASYNADIKELQNLDRSLQTRYAARADKDNRRINELTKAASDYIDNFLIEYNKTKKYDAILDRAAGLYFNPALDITDEVVKALNEAYNKAQEDKK